MRYYSNVAARTTLDNAGGIDSSETSIELQSASGWPTSFPFTMRLDPGTADEELVTVNSGSGTPGTPYVVTRGVDGTSAKAHAEGCIVTHSISARDLKEPQDHIAALVGHDDTQDHIDNAAIHKESVRARLKNDTGSTISTTETAELTLSISIPAGWATYDIEVDVFGRVLESSAASGNSTITGRIRKTNVAGAIWGSTSIIVSDVNPGNFAPLIFSGYAEGETTTGTVDIALTMVINLNNGLYSWDDVVMYARAYRIS